MKILFAHKFYGRKGGPEEVIYGMGRRLKMEGHISIPFSMKDDFNQNSPYRRFFVKNSSYLTQMRNVNPLEKLKVALKVIYSLEAKRKVEKLVEQEKPDIAHIHNIYHQISPSILLVLKKRGIPVVQTLHDLKLICPNYKMYVRGKVCEKCKDNRYYYALLTRCVKDSISASLLNCIEAYIHKATRIYEKNVNLFVSPSSFLYRKMVEFGINPDKMIVIPNGLEVSCYQPSYSYSDYFLYLGRLDQEKGIFTLVEAVKKLKSLNLWIVGSGSDEEQLREIVCKGKMKNVKFLGFLTGNSLREAIQNAMFIIIPSEWYENCSISLLESMAYGKPVIGARIGGIPEQIENGINGLLFEPGNVEDLASKIDYLSSHPRLIVEMGKNARRKVEQEYSMNRHYEKVMGIYKDLLTHSLSNGELLRTGIKW